MVYGCPIVLIIIILQKQLECNCSTVTRINEMFNNRKKEPLLLPPLQGKELFINYVFWMNIPPHPPNLRIAFEDKLKIFGFLLRISKFFDYKNQYRFESRGVVGVFICSGTFPKF